MNDEEMERYTNEWKENSWNIIKSIIISASEL